MVGKIIVKHINTCAIEGLNLAGNVGEIALSWRIAETIGWVLSLLHQS
jgi:hypothetical protein